MLGTIRWEMSSNYFGRGRMVECVVELHRDPVSFTQWLYCVAHLYYKAGRIQSSIFLNAYDCSPQSGKTIIVESLNFLTHFSASTVASIRDAGRR